MHYVLLSQIVNFGKTGQLFESSDRVSDEFGVNNTGPAWHHGIGSELFKLVDVVLVHNGHNFAERDRSHAQKLPILECEMFDGCDKMRVCHGYLCVKV